MPGTLRRPTERTCERCGREERVSPATGSWVVETVGNVYCIHEWDINGTFVPFEDEGRNAEA